MTSGPERSATEQSVLDIVAKDGAVWGVSAMEIPDRERFPKDAPETDTSATNAGGDFRPNTLPETSLANIGIGSAARHSRGKPLLVVVNDSQRWDIRSVFM